MTVSRGQAAALGLMAALLLAVAWLADPPAGPVMALAGGVLGWVLCRVTPRAAAAPQPVPVVAPDVALQAPVVPASVQPPECTDMVAATVARNYLSALRHDIRGILAPAMLIAERLLAHDDPAVKRAGELVCKMVDRAAAKLSEKPGF